ncbi:MAG: DNA polymerase I [Agathobacter sp.]|uniref:DNA polymerase I n=1 Tax=Agathobacter sp. TaxID=2021311 RepID=UPI0039934513
MSKKLVLIDGHSILNRAFFGLPDLTNSQGVHTNAVYGFLNIMFKILEEEKPDYLTVAFDVHAPTFRHKMFEEYKGTRKPMADELRQQVPLIKEMLKAMGITIVEKEGYEADDILGTLSVKAEKEGMDVAVISGDRDLLQLATEHVMIRIPKTKKTGTEIENYLADDVVEKYGVTPKEFIDVKALQGDTADNIPGVPGIGEKTAGALIAKYHSIEAVHEDAPNVKPPRASKNIVEFWDQAVMSKELATIITDAPVDYEFKDAQIDGIDSLYTEEAFMMCKRLEFKNLLPRFDVQAPKNNVEENFKVISDKKSLDDIIKRASKKDVAFSIIPGKPGGEDTDGQLSLFEQNDTNDYIALVLVFSEEDIYFIKTGKEITSDYLNKQLEALDANTWISPDLKKNLHLMKAGGFTPDERKKYFDMTVAAYLLNPLLGDYPYDGVAKDYLSIVLSSKKDYLGKLTCEQMIKEDEKKVVDYACYEAYIAWKSKEILESNLKEKGMYELYENIEMPLVFVLYDMEKEGIRADGDKLKEYSRELAVSINKIEKRIYEEAGEEFNINSPKQLGIVLFEKLQLPNEKKTKTGYSTSAEVLDKLAPDHPIVADVLEYRQLSKLKSTYADGLINFIEQDGKIHTTFNQTITATGRLSSTDPNLQNIPIRIELGKLIRKVFLPEQGHLFVDSDYSQIELRVLAHLSDDEKLIAAFKNGQDIHRSTASLVFDTPFDEVTDIQRRNAKAVNFGIVYGISAFGLANDLNIGRKEAQAYIDSYFEKYPKIKAFLDKTVADAKEKGYIKTMFGRIRPIPELSSSNFMQRQFGERVAMNSPIQGTAADIIKIAMIRVHDRLLKENLKSKLILQVHDELLIETAEDEKEYVIELLEEEMHKAADLKVSMEVGTECGYDWYDAH